MSVLRFTSRSLVFLPERSPQRGPQMQFVMLSVKQWTILVKTILTESGAFKKIVQVRGKNENTMGKSTHKVTTCKM